MGSGDWGVGSGEWGKWRLCRIGAPAGWLGESCSGLQQSKGGRCEGRGRRVGRARARGEDEDEEEGEEEEEGEDEEEEEEDEGVWERGNRY